MQSPASGARHWLGITLGVTWMLAAAAAAQVPVPAAPTPAAPDEALQRELLAALAGCRTPRDLPACESASQHLESLIAVAEQPAERARRPRCLGSLTQLQTHLSVFRWGFEPRQQLQGQMDQAMLDCPVTPTSR